jgi:hypothetical protein
VARLTFADLKAYAKHSLHGGDPNAVFTDADTTKGHIVNQAGRHLFFMHEWSWKTRPTAVGLDLVSGQNYVEMPYDFDGLDSIIFTSSITNQVILTSLAQVQEIEASVVSDPFNSYVAMVYPTQASVQEGPKGPRLQITPVPTADSIGALTANYRAGWLELVSSTSVPNVLAKYEGLLLDLIMAYAKKQDDEAFQSAIEDIERSSMLRNLKSNDGMVQAGSQMPTGGMVNLSEVFSEGGNFSPHDQNTLITSAG